ncbi:MAG TPA: hypothetical protein VGB14_11545 [Acidimicrobiales bacterium]
MTVIDLGPLLADDDEARHVLGLEAETPGDYAALVAVAVRYREGRWVPFLRPFGSRLPDVGFPSEPVHRHVADGDLFSTEEFHRFQVLWYRWHAPRDVVPPMRWYLTAAWPSTEAPASLAADVDLCMEQLAARRPNRRAELLTEVLKLPRDAGLVAGWGDPRWAVPAILHAGLTGRPFLWFDTPEELVEAVDCDVDDVTVAVPLPELDLPLVHGLLRARSFRVGLPRVGEVDLCSRPLSFLAARTVEVLSRVVARHQLYDGVPVRDATWLFTGEQPGHEVDPDVTYLSREEATAAHLELAGDADLLVLSGHSREDLFHVGGDALCGRSVDADTPSAGPLPACATDGRCVKDGEVLPVRRLGAKVMLVHGCNVLRLGGGSFAPEFTIAFSALEGRCNAVVASRRTRFGHTEEQVLLHQLLRTGRTLGEAVRLVNNTLPFTGPESPDYLVLGEGGWAPYPGVDGSADVVVDREGDGWRVTATAVDTPVLEVVLLNVTDEVWVRPDGDREAWRDVYAALAPEPDGSARLLVFGWRRLVADRLSFVVGSGTPSSDAVAALVGAARSAPYRRLLRGTSPRFDNQERELRSLSTAVARELTEARRRPLAVLDLEERAAAATDLLARMDEAVCSSLLDRIGAGAFVWLEQCTEVDGTFRVEEHLPAGTCPYCGAVVVRKAIRHLFDPAVARDFGLCQTCGNVWDAPLGGIRPELAGDPVLRRGTVAAQQVVVRNPFDRAVRGFTGFRLYQADRHGVVVRPGVAEVTVPARGVVTVGFEIEVGTSVPAHMEFLRGFWASELDVAVFQRNVWVVP